MTARRSAAACLLSGVAVVLILAGCGKLTGPGEGDEVLDENFFPVKPQYPFPTKDTTNVDTALTLTWVGGDPDSGDVVTYTLYFGTQPSPTTQIAVLQGDTDYVVSGLAYETRYYWKVVASDGELTRESDVWAFTTTYRDWETYTEANSDLPEDEVTALLADDDGTLWVGTGYGGLGLFDGTSWDVYNSANSDLPGDGVTAIARGASGDKWLVCFERALVHVSSGMQMASYDTIITASNDTFALSGFAVASVAIDKEGAAWVGTIRGGLFRFDGVRWDAFRMASLVPADRDLVTEVFVDTSRSTAPFGIVYVPTSAGLMAITDLDTTCREIRGVDTIVVTFDTTWVVDTATGDTVVGSIAQLLDTLAHKVADTTLFRDTLWVAGETSYPIDSTMQLALDSTRAEDSLFIRVQIIKWRSELAATYDLHNIASGMPDSVARAAFVDDGGTLWAGMWSGGAAEYNGSAWQSYSIETTGFPSNIVTCITQDASGTMWVGTEQGGLVAIETDNSVQVYLPDVNSTLPSASVISLAVAPDDRLWIGTKRGLTLFQNR